MRAQRADEESLRLWAARAAFVALERFRHRNQHDGAHGEALRAWTTAHASRWDLIDRFERGGRVYLIMVRCRDESPRSGLTRREREALDLIASGCSNKFAAFELGISPSGVAMRLRTAMRKLGVTDRAALIRAAARGSLCDGTR